MYDKSQLNKGILEGCILKIISRRSTYGYDILTHLTKVGFTNIKESTIYPLLVRLEKKGYITCFYEVSLIGPSRKYFEITETGLRYLNEFVVAWHETENFVNYVLETEE